MRLLISPILPAPRKRLPEESEDETLAAKCPSVLLVSSLTKKLKGSKQNVGL